MSIVQLGIPWARGSNTSRKSAEAQSHDRARGARVALLIQAYRQAGSDGLCDFEAVKATGLPLQSVCSIRNGLMEDGLVGKGRERMGLYGKNVTVFFWIAAEARRA